MRHIASMLERTLSELGLGHCFQGSDPPLLRPSSLEVFSALLALLEAESIAACLDARHFPYDREAVLFDLSALNTVREYDKADLVIGVETGIRWGELRQMLAKDGLSLGLRYPDHALLADILMQDRPALELGFRRSLKELVLGMEVLSMDGTLTKSGGRVVKNVTGYDLHKFYIGSHYPLVIPSAVFLRLAVAPSEERFYRIACPELDSLKSLTETVLAYPPAVLCQWTVANADSLDSSLPGWHLLIRSEGDPLLLDAFEQELKSLCTDAALTLNEARVQKERLFQQIMAPAIEEVRLEVALPFAMGLERYADFPFPPALERQIHIPACGLWVLSSGQLPEDPEALAQSLLRLKETVEEAGGHLLLTHFPEELAGLAAQLNLPGDSLLFQLSGNLKYSTDPKGLLYSPVFPIPALQESYTQLSYPELPHPPAPPASERPSHVG